VTRHARAGRAEVSVAAEGGFLELEVHDDGCGVDAAATGGRGLGNMRARARQLGGDLELVARDGGGAALRWWAPLT
jgi:signal transduction histidine kinase